MMTHIASEENQSNRENMEPEALLASAPEAASESEICNFYRGRCVLVTGGSGFVGKVLIEKLLRSCVELKKIFLLVRPKRDKQPRERINEIIGEQLFEKVRDLALKKIIVVEGDVTQPKLGLSDQNLDQIINEVTVVFHSAATVKFDEPLKQSIAINLFGTKNIIDICRQIPNLAALVHVSTAYANCDRPQIDEHVYPVNIDPEHLIDIAKWLEQDTLQELKSKLLESKPNTYTYTKALAEWLLMSCARDLPVVICRPSIVVASWREPFSGWIDNINGPTGIILGAAKGVIRSMFVEVDLVADLVPVDTVANLIIGLAKLANEYSAVKGPHGLGGSSSASFMVSDELEKLALTFKDELNCKERDDLTGATTNLVDHDNNNKDKKQTRHLADESLAQPSRVTSSPTDDGYGSLSLAGSNKSTRSSSLSLDHEDASSVVARSFCTTGSADCCHYNDEDDEDDELEATSRASKRVSKRSKLKRLRRNIVARLREKNLPDHLADIPVFHCTSGSTNPITWGQLQGFILKMLILFPSITTYRYPSEGFTNSDLLDKFYSLTLHYIPGHFFDLIAKLTGNKPFLVRVFRKFDQAAKVLRTFTSREWKFNTENSLLLQNELMSEEDKRLFSIDLSSLDWADFSRDYVLGIRRFLFKEQIENLQQARYNLRVTYFRNLLLQVGALLGAGYFMMFTVPQLIA